MQKSSSFTISLLLWILAIIPAVAYVYPLPREMGVYQGVPDALPVLSDSHFDHLLVASPKYREFGARLQTAGWQDNQVRSTQFDCAKILHTLTNHGLPPSADQWPDKMLALAVVDTRAANAADPVHEIIWTTSGQNYLPIDTTEKRTK